MRVLIVGAQGMLGTDLVEVFGAGHQVLGLDLPGFDLTRADECRARLFDFRPELVINAAALTAVDYCETHEEEALLVNGEGAGILARAAAGVSARFVHYSTDYVFDGKKAEPYVEDDPTAPLSSYGRSKLKGEELVREAASDHLILRTAWLFGRNGRNFIRTIYQAARGGENLRVVHDQRGSPTYALDLARHTLLLLNAGCRGTYHLVNSGFCTWYELATQVVLWSGLSVPVTPVTTQQNPRPAPRPRNSTLAGERLRREGLPAMRPWQEAARAYVDFLVHSDAGVPQGGT